MAQAGIFLDISAQRKSEESRLKEKYRECIHKFTDEIEDPHILCKLYSYAQKKWAAESK